MTEVGQVIESDSGCFLWIIDDFLSHWYPDSREYADIKSPEFKFSDSLCRLHLGLTRSGRLSLCLCVREHDGTSIKLHVRLGMTTGHRGEKETRSGEVNTLGYFAVKTWMKCSEILERRLEILRNGRLTVSCEIRRLDIEESASMPSTENPNAVEEEVAVETGTSEKGSDDEEESIIDWEIVRKLLKDLNNLLKTGEDSDVTIKVQGKEFSAHRNILRARSPVFRSMFSHEMVEKQSGVVVIDDCDPVTFPDFLKCLYTGSTSHICDENVYQLYTASDKYAIDGLKWKCAEFMKNNLSVDRFCDTITLALRHNEKELVGLATAFFCANARKITKTAKWQIFLRENSTVGNELFIKALSNGKDI